MAICKVCGAEITGRRIYCGDQCRWKASKERKKEAVQLARDIPKRDGIIETIKANGGTPWSYAEAQKAESIKLFARVNLDEFFTSKKHIL